MSRKYIFGAATIILGFGGGIIGFHFSLVGKHVNIWIYFLSIVYRDCTIYELRIQLSTQVLSLIQLSS